MITAKTKALCRKHGHEFAPANSVIAPRAVFCVLCGVVLNGVVMSKHLDDARIPAEAKL